ncbi:ATP-binding protein [Bifidobacterium parmae]|uniref:P-loop containing region of AAA domain-containing protein n=1 Tax=Bifidobacterium parmae TaxID=361854 RepID=A0A2N5IZ44_9BIFI|nr:ATP-binding protein [Bifidobacterium parmae]PLS27231.1 P-loop containing region of AAA domain-containing protein [Bifidobacterium parmae]
MAARELQMIADRWMMESRCLVNWGSYQGYHEFRPSTDPKLPVTLLAGASESGKSTLVDAQISLLYPTGTPFNKASNSGRSERSDYTYLRGMIGVGSTAGGDEPVYLRGRDGDGAPQAVWGAIVDTYVNATSGQTLSCAKFLYLMAGDGRSDVRRQYAAWGKPIDPRLMDAYRDHPFTPTQLKDTYPGCETFTSADAFHEHIWDVMGLSEDACRLLHKIQSADAPSRLDDIFKQGVLGVPEALKLARDTVDDYERYEANFTEMERKAKRVAALAGIRDACDAYDAARRRVRTLDPVDPGREDGAAAIRHWATARMADEVAARLPIDERERREHQTAAETAYRDGEKIRAGIDAIRDRIRGLDGGNLARMEMELEQARRALADVKTNRGRIEAGFEAIGETMPGDEHAWTERRIAAVDFTRLYDRRAQELDETRDRAVAARSAADDELRRLERDYERQKTQRTRITQQMDETRAMLCRATGLSAGELPYVAELMDVRESEERWRLAMNVTYGAIAQTILVDKRHERGFAAKVSAIDPHAMARRTWQFVDTTEGFDADDGKTKAADDRPWMSSKLRYREDSPFAGWLRAQTASERFDAVCVDAIDDADREHRQVQADGQIKSGRRGQHGVKDRREVIGYVTEAYLEALEHGIAEARDRSEQAERDYTEAKRRAEALRSGLELAKQLAYTSWENVDVESASAKVDGLETSIAAIRNNPELAELVRRRESMEEELDRNEQRRFAAKRDADAAAAACEAARRWLDAHRDHTSRGIGADADDAGHGNAIPLDDGTETALEHSYEDGFSGIADTALRAHMIIGAGTDASAAGTSFPERVIARMRDDMAGRIDALAAQASAAKTVVEARMESYKGMYAADDDALSATVEDRRYYLDELEGLSRLTAGEATGAEYRRCLEQLLMSLLTIKRAVDTDEADIRDQLDRINAMLDGQRFGPRHGSLSLHADVRKPDRGFSSQLTRTIGALNDWKSSGSDDPAAMRKVFASCGGIIGLLRAQLAQVKDANGVKSYGARDLDPRCRSAFYAIVHHEDGLDERITSTGGRSGGALQELTSFVYGAALIYLLGGGMENRLRPSYTTLFLDEALIKADGRYTQRALTVLPRLGFQVIVSAPESKTGEILEVSTKAYVTYKNPDTGLTSLREADLAGEDEAVYVA